MDRSQFDDLARLVAGRRTRRGAIAALLGATLLSQHSAAVRPKRRRRKRKRHENEPGGQPGALAPCFPGTTCQPDRGRTHAGCDFGGSDLLSHRDLRGAVLSGANFTLADLTGADLRGAVLSDACLVAANLTGAIIDESTVLGGAIFCRTLMPDASLDDSGCERGTRCCPTPTICEGDCSSCQSYGDFCQGLFPDCCDVHRLTCTSTAIPDVATCQTSCDDDQDCLDAFQDDLGCVTDNFDCAGFADHKCCRCCKACSSDADCPFSRQCCRGRAA